MPTDPPAFSDEAGKVSVDWLRSFGLLSEHEYCCWRSNWTTHSDWQYSTNFRTPQLLWKDTLDAAPAAAVRRRTMRQICQIEWMRSNKPTRQLKGGSGGGSEKTVAFAAVDTSLGSVGGSDRDDASIAPSVASSVDTITSPRRESRLASPTPSASATLPPLNWTFVDDDVSLPVDVLHKMLFGDDSEFDGLAREQNGHTSVAIEPWEDQKRSLSCMFARCVRRFLEAGDARD